MKRIFKFSLIALAGANFIISCSILSNASIKGGDTDFREFIGTGKYTGTYWPTDKWRTCKPEEVGMRTDKLLKAIEFVANPDINTQGIVIIRDGYIVGEAYFGDFTIDSRHVSHSMAKSFTSALIGIAIAKGLIEGVDEKICRYYKEWDCNDRNDPRSRISIRHAMTLTTGLEWQEDWTKWDPATNDALKMGASGYFVEYMSARKGLYEPGQRFCYSTGDPMLLSRVIQKATGMTAFEFARRNLFKPLHITNVSWEHDQHGYTSTAWGLHTTVRDYAKFGYLFLRRGRWEGRQIVPEQWVEKSTRTDPGVKMWRAYGYLWHVNLPYRLQWSRSPVSSDAIPSDGYMAEGVLGQYIFIIPSKNIVIARVADDRSGGKWVVEFLTMVLDAIIK